VPWLSSRRVVSVVNGVALEGPLIAGLTAGTG
jgi:hypothetical protein